MDDFQIERDQLLQEIRALRARIAEIEDAALSSGTTEAQATRTLLESEEKFRAVVEQSADCIFLAEIKTTLLLDANVAFRRLLGYSSLETTELRLSDFMIAPPGGTAEEAWAPLLESRQTAFERKFRRKDGSRVDMEVNANLIHYGDRDVLCVVSRNITERRQAEEKRQRMHDQLLQAQKMEAVGTLASGVAHDFNNLLTSIQGFTELAILKVENPQAVKKYLNYVTSTTKQAGELTRQLLLFSRKHVAEFSPIDINLRIQNLLKLLPPLIGETIQIETRCAEGLWAVVADKSHMEQVIMNLVVNARDAMPSGGTVTITTENVTRETVTADEETKTGSFVRLSVSDTGMGMSPEVRENLFLPFFSTKESGTGLGLSMVHSIVQDHNGLLQVESAPGKGSTFHVLLPAVRDEARRDTEHILLTHDEPGTDQCILVVEDETSVREFAVLSLSEFGYRVLEAEGIQEAWDRLSEAGKNIDLLLSDVVLPDGNGLDLARKVLDEKDSLPVILMSGHTGRKAGLNQIREMGLPFLQKPFTVSQLLSTVRETLDPGRDRP